MEKKNKKGFVTVEYVVLLSVVLGIAIGIITGFNSGVKDVGNTSNQIVTSTIND